MNFSSSSSSFLVESFGAEKWRSILLFAFGHGRDVCMCALATLSPPLPNCFRCFRSRSRLVRRKFGLMVGGLSRMFRIFNGRIKEGRIGEGEKVFYLGAIKGVEGFLNGRTRLDFRWVKRRKRRRKRRGSFVIQREAMQVVPSRENKAGLVVVVLPDRADFTPRIYRPR